MQNIRSRRILSLSVSASLVVVMLNVCCEVIATDAIRPNIVLFVADDLGWSDLGYSGSSFYESPNIDALSKRGMIFTNAYSNGPNCAPSRASLISGMYTDPVSIKSENLVTVGVFISPLLR